MIEIKPLYSIAELSELIKLHRNSIVRLLEAEGVEFVWVGRKRFVPLASIRDKLPQVWESVFAAGELY